MNKLTNMVPPLTMVAPEFLFVAPENPRSEEGIDPDELHDLMASIAENGILTPLIGYQQGINFYITAGGRRVRALHALKQADTGKILAPVTVMEKEAAIHAGHAEQLSHVAMDDVDELRLFRHPAYSNLTDEKLGARVGRSPRYVAQRREILRLPETMIEAVLGYKIDIDQAIGLTYAKSYPETQADFFQRALKDRRFDAAAMRRAMKDTVRGWNDYCHAQLVTRDDYIAAGGRLQEDLFTGNPLVLDAQILLQLATEKARDVMKERFPDAAFIMEADEDTRLYDIPTHRGIWGLNDAESKEWHKDLGWWEMSRLERASQADEDDPDYDEIAAIMAKEELERRKARKAELEPRAAYLYPEPLAKLLGVAWKLTDGPMRNYHGELLNPIEVREHVLPADLSELSALGYIDKPAEKEPAKEVALEDNIGIALGIRIQRIRAHALRMELSKSTDLVLKLFAKHLSGKLGRSVVFAIDPDAAFHPDPDMKVTYSSQWEKLEQLGKADSEGIEGFTQKEVRDVLAYRILMCLSLGNPQAKELDAATIRRWWTPDAGFLSAYSKPQLLAMLKPLRPDDDFTKEKRGPLAEILARIVAQEKAWLPFGFCKA